VAEPVNVKNAGFFFIHACPVCICVCRYFKVQPLRHFM